MAKKRLRVIGGVAAGPAAASRARRTDPDLDIVIYEKGPFNSYGACNEPYYIGGWIDDYHKFMERSPEQFKGKMNIDVLTRHEVLAINPKDKTITVKNIEDGSTFSDPYDKLIIATGTSTRRISVPGSDLPGVFRMKELDETIAMKKYIESRKPRRVVTVGAGFIALEAAEAFKQLGMENTIVHRGDSPVARLDSDVSQIVIDEIKKQDIKFMPSVDFNGISASGDSMTVKTSAGDLPADMVLVAVGVTPNVDLARDAGIEIGETGAIHVNERQETNVENIYAAGDCCEVRNRIGGHYVSVALGDVSNKQGWVAGENAAGGDTTYPGVLGSAHFKFCDLEIAFTGLSQRDADRLNLKAAAYSTRAYSRVRAFPKSSPVLIKLLIEQQSGRLLGAQMIGRDGVAHRINILATAIYNEMSVNEIANIDFAYAPPFTPVIDPVLRAARGAVKELGL